MPIPVPAIGLVVAGIDALITYLEKRAKQGEAAREEVADTTDMDAAHEALQAAFAPVGVEVDAPSDVPVAEENARAALPLLKQASALLKGEA